MLPSLASDVCSRFAPLVYRSTAGVALSFKAIGSQLQTVPMGIQVVTVTDWRYCPITSEEAAGHLLQSMPRTTRGLLRSGALASQSAPIAVLQVLRLVRQSKHQSRRLFFAEDALASWLGGVLGPTQKRHGSGSSSASPFRPKSAAA